MLSHWGCRLNAKLSGGHLWTFAVTHSRLGLYRADPPHYVTDLKSTRDELACWNENRRGTFHIMEAKRSGDRRAMNITENPARILLNSKVITGHKYQRFSFYTCKCVRGQGCTHIYKHACLSIQLLIFPPPGLWKAGWIFKQDYLLE